MPRWVQIPNVVLKLPLTTKAANSSDPIKLTVQDTGCNAEGGQAAATKLAADPTIVAAIGSNCSSEARPGAPILWKAGIATVSPSIPHPI